MAKIFVTDKKRKADAKVFLVDRDYKADLLFFEVDKDYKAKWKNSHSLVSRIGA